MEIDVDFGNIITDISEEVQLYRYPITIDDNGHRIIDTDNPKIYRLLASVQQLDAEADWTESGVSLEEHRKVFFEYPYRSVSGKTYKFDVRTVEQSKEDEFGDESPVDGINYKDARYDIVEKTAEYPKYGYQAYVIKRV